MVQVGNVKLIDGRLGKVKVKLLLAWSFSAMKSLPPVQRTQVKKVSILKSNSDSQHRNARIVTSLYSGMFLFSPNLFPLMNMIFL